MRSLTHILLLALAALALAAGGCRRSPGEAERRLMALDSLTATVPDSALALLQAVDSAALAEPERAYLALLLTQAQGKARVPATDSALICRAWRYYRHHGPYDRRIRTMTYRAAVAEELGQPEQAMRWYKLTELAAREHGDDYNAGYALMSMAALYQESLLFQQAISKYRGADSLLDALDTEAALFAKQQLAQLYMTDECSNADSANLYIQLSKQIASRGRDSAMMVYAEMLRVEKLFYDSCFDDCYRAAIAAIKNYGHLNQPICWYMASQSLALTGHADSAKALLSHAPAPASMSDSIEYHHSLSLISSAQGDWRLAHAFEAKSEDVSDSILLSAFSNNLEETENDAINQIAAHSAKSKATKRFALQCTALGIVLAALLWLLLHYRQTIKRHLGKIDWLTGINGRLARRLRRTQHSIDEKDKEILQVRQNLRQLESASNNAAMQMTAIEAQLKQKELEIAALTDTLASTEAEIERLARELSSKQEHFDSLSRESSQALHSAQAELGQARQAIAAVKAERDKTLEQKALVQEALREAEATVLSLSRKNADIKFIQTLYAQMSAAFAKWIEDFAGMANDYYLYQGNAEKFMKKFKTHLEQNINGIDLWQQIESFINSTHHGALKAFREKHPEVPANELKLLMLSVLGFDVNATAICLGLRSANVVYSLKSRLKKRLHCSSAPEVYLLSIGGRGQRVEK